MRILLHLHDQKQLIPFNDPYVDFIITEPFYSYKHPSLQTKADFLNVLQCALLTGQKTYVEINDFIEEGDLEGLKTWITELCTYPIQGFYFADLAALVFLNELDYHGVKIYAPETILTNTREIKTYLDYVDRIMISKELTLAEILILSTAFPNKVELFGAGHLQMAVSKRPLLSSYLKEIGQNLPTLNQTDYRLRELKRPEKMPILEETKTFCVFTEGVLNPLEEIPQLIQAHVYGMHCDPLLLDDQEALVFFKLILSQVKVFDPNQIRDFSTMTKLPLFKGYFYRKTNLNKETP